LGSWQHNLSMASSTPSLVGASRTSFMFFYERGPTWPHPFVTLHVSLLLLLLYYSFYFIIVRALLLLALLLLLFCYYSCFANTPHVSLLLLVFCCSPYFATIPTSLHYHSSYFVVPPASLLLLLRFIVAPCASLLLLLLHFVVPLAPLLMLFCCSSFMHRYYVVFRYYVALSSTFLPLVGLLLLCASCFIVIQCFVVPLSKLVFFPPPFFL
jgi:hypothetical protein